MCNYVAYNRFYKLCSATDEGGRSHCAPSSLLNRSTALTAAVAVMNCGVLCPVDTPTASTTVHCRLYVVCILANCADTCLNLREVRC